MVIVKLKGGLGNQLFQFAFGRAIAATRKDQLFFDLTDLTENPHHFNPRTFNLEYLNNYQLADQQTLNDFNELYQAETAVYISDDFPKDIIVPLIHLKQVKAIMLDGYFQDKFYFLTFGKLIKREIKDMLTWCFKTSGISAHDFIPIDQQSVSIHLRRTDYLEPAALNLHGICEVDYYQEALKIIISRLSHPYFYLFSDDDLQADEIFSALIMDKTNISSIIQHSSYAYKDLLELGIMSHCKNFIIANSSYSWWGSYLSDEATKIIIAPKNWYRDKKFNQMSEAISLPSWIRI